MNIYCKKICCAIIFLLCACIFASCMNINDLFTVQSKSEVSDSYKKNSSINKDKTNRGQSNAAKLTEVTTPYYEKVSLNYGYENLASERQKELYDKMLQSIYLITEKTNEKGQYEIQPICINSSELSELDIRIVMEAFVCDHPEFFWLSNSFGYSFGNYISTVNFYSFLSLNQVYKYENDLLRAIKEITENIPADLSSFDRELYIHDVLLNNCSYDEKINDITDDPMAFSIYGVLVNNKAVCEGYSKTIQYLLSIAGIESITVNGKSKNNLHQWNLVNLNGKWYHLDVTWDDSEQDYITYSYFNLSDELIKTDHMISKDYRNVSEEEVVNEENYDNVFNLILPECNSMTENFYTKKAVTFTGFTSDSTDSNMIDSLNEIAQSGEENFFMKIDDSLNFNDTVDKLFSEEPYKFFDYINTVNDNLDVKLSDSLSMTSNEYQKTVQVFLKYEQ